MPKRITAFRVPLPAATHMWEKHGVSLEETLEAARNATIYRRAGDSQGLGQRYLAASKTDAGRRLWVVLKEEGERAARLITAREPQGRKEVQRHRRMRGE